VVEALEDHPNLLALAVRQRAKWEGWLKFELAARAEREGYGPVGLEEAYGQWRADITLHDDHERYDVELKTPNANWRVPGVQDKHRPITNNIAGIVADARKLAFAPDQGVVCFALFPVPAGSAAWAVYLERIAGELGMLLSEAEHCSRVRVNLGVGQACEVVVCAFLYPADGRAISQVAPLGM
jgi:hypothetical protein